MESKTVVNAWRDHFNIPTTDPRFLNATLSDIYDDYLIYKLRELSDFFAERVPEGSSKKKDAEQISITQDEFDKLNEEDVQAIKMCEANYATDEEIEQAANELEEVMGRIKVHKSLTECNRDDIIRAVQLKIRDGKISKQSTTD